MQPSFAMHFRPQSPWSRLKAELPEVWSSAEQDLQFRSSVSVSVILYGCEIWSVIVREEQDMDRWRAVVNAVMDGRVAYNAGYFSTSWGTGSFSGRTLLHVISYETGGLPYAKGLVI